MRPVKLQSRALTPSLEPGVSQLGIPGHFKHNLNLLVLFYFSVLIALAKPLFLLSSKFGTLRP